MAIKTNAPIEIKALSIKTIIVPVIGESELIVHAWSEKAKKMMLDKQMGAAKTKRALKDPEQDYRDSMYHDAQGNNAFPSTGFKAAIVGACRMVDGLPMTIAKIAFHVDGEFTRIYGTPHMREDMVRLETGVADIRYRAAFFPWGANLKITYNAGVISDEQLANLINLAGFGGIGEWRPSAPKSATGSFGRFRVHSSAMPDANIFGE